MPESALRFDATETLVSVAEAFCCDLGGSLNRA